MNFVQLWLTGLINPWRAFATLRSKPAPVWGFWAVLIRFVGTALTTTLPLHLLGRRPFEPSCLTFLPTDRYYAAEVWFLPLFGLAMWLLGSAVVHLALRLSGYGSNFDQILNIVGLAMLIPMPVIWPWDLTMVAANYYHVAVMAVSHSLFALWEAVLCAIDLKGSLELRRLPAFGLGLAVQGVYIPLAMIFIR